MSSSGFLALILQFEFSRAFDFPWLLQTIVVMNRNHESRTVMEIQRMQITAPPTETQSLYSALASLTGPREMLPGCLSSRILQSWHDSDELFVEIDWESKEDLIRYLQSADFKRLLLLMELSPRAPVIQFFSVIEFRGLDLVEVARGPYSKVEVNES